MPRKTLTEEIITNIIIDYNNGMPCKEISKKQSDQRNGYRCRTYS